MHLVYVCERDLQVCGRLSILIASARTLPLWPYSDLCACSHIRCRRRRCTRFIIMSLFFSVVFDDISGEDLQDFAAIHIVRLDKVVNLLFTCVYCNYNIKLTLGMCIS
jgi:hypothetical protein